MTDHEQHDMHPNSLDAYAAIKSTIGKRKAAIIEAVRVLRIATDLQVMTHLGFTDPNKVRPRISELIRKGLLREIGWERTQDTHKRVRLVEISR